MSDVHECAHGVMHTICEDCERDFVLEVETLREQRDELAEALRECLEVVEDEYGPDCSEANKARAALAKAGNERS